MAAFLSRPQCYPLGTNLSGIWITIKRFHTRKYPWKSKYQHSLSKQWIRKCCLQNGGFFCVGFNVTLGRKSPWKPNQNKTIFTQENAFVNVVCKMTAILHHAYAPNPSSLGLFHWHWGRRRADSRFAPSQWETALLYNYFSHWHGASLESVPRRMISPVPVH